MAGRVINDSTIAFVSDWKKRADEQQKKYILLFISAFAAAFIICILSFFWFQNRNYRRIVRQNMQYVQDSAIQEANQIENDMKQGEVFIKNLANQYALLIKFDENETIEKRLELISDKNIFDRIAFITSDGVDTSLEGKALVSDRDYFKNAMKGECGWELVKKSRVTGKPTIVFYAPVVVDGSMAGVMAGFYEKDRLEDLFSYQLFNYTPMTYLLLGDGTVVADSLNDRRIENALETLSEKKYIGDTDFEEIMAVIEDEGRTIVTFSYADGRATRVGVIVQFRDSDWMLLSVLPNNVTSSMVSNANQIGTILLIVIVLTFLSLMLVMFLFLNKERDRRTHEMKIAVDNLEATVREEEKQFTIIESLGDVYASIYYIDLEEELYQRIKETGTLSLFIPETGDAKAGFSSYVEHYVDDSDKGVLKEFLSVDTIRNRIEENGSESIEYQRLDKSWRRGILAPAGRDENGVLSSVVFAVQKIDQEKQKELQTKKALEEAYEAAQVANKAKTTFLSNMSHDIRTPMNAIVGMTAIAAANLDNTDKVSDCLKKITSSSKHLLGLINEVLDMSKIESGKVDLCEEAFSLSDLIDDLIQINQPQIKEKNHTLYIKINNLKHEKVIGDSTRLQQVFTNLLSNAIKYTPENGKLEITVTEKETTKTTVGVYEVIFKDNGIGMSEEFCKNLFEPFTRAKDDRISKIQGTGLGMPIAKNIINMMNGDITVESSIDKGTVFTVTFILKLQTEDEKDHKRFVDLPVLVVDDDVTACESTCTILDSLEMNSEWVTSGREAVEKTVEHHETGEDYYAVIVDWKMPDMNGVETTREIRRRVDKDIPIIVISAYDWTDIEQEAREAGVNAFLSKPLFKSRVVSLFSELMDNNQGRNTVNLKDEGDRYALSGKRILLVEDNDINREIAQELLSMAGLKLETAEDGKAGLDMFLQAQPGYYDLILMDIQMPVMNGYEATEAIRKSSHPDAKDIPIIAMTANAFASDVRDALDAGMNGHIAKPIDINKVIKILHENMGGVYEDRMKKQPDTELELLTNEIG